MSFLICKTVFVIFFNYSGDGMGVITHTLARIYKGTHPFNANSNIYVGKVQVFDEKYFFKL